MPLEFAYTGLVASRRRMQAVLDILNSWLGGVTYYFCSAHCRESFSRSGATIRE